MSNKLTIGVILKKWLQERMHRGVYVLSTSDIETNLVHYGKEYWGILHTPSTYGREWRDFRRLGRYKDIDISAIKEIPTKSRQKTWKIEIG
jgi:hypothetical protein